MIGSNGWRLLAAFALFVVITARGQDSSVVRLESPAGAASRNFSRPVEPIQIHSPLLPAKNPPARGTAFSSRIVSAAGIIFSGRVTSVRRAESSAGITAAPTVITFQVDQGIRGTATGQVLTIREWAGLWDRGERYRVGESVFLCLYPPSRLGLTSPVSGGSGRFAIDARRRIVVNAQNSATLAFDPMIVGETEIPYADFERAVRSAVGP